MTTTTKRHLTSAAVAAAVACGLILTGCGDSDGADTPGGSGSDATGPVTVEFWGWVPEIETAIDAWNAANPDIQVNFSRIPGSSDLYPKAHAAVQAGNAPCLAQIAYYMMPSFLADGDLLDVTAEAANSKSVFVPWTWNQVTFGGKTYGIPQDTGPMVMFYRTDLFEQYGISPAATWEQFAQDAAKVHAASPDITLTNFGPDQPDLLAAFTSQAGGQWWEMGQDAWTVSIDSAESLQVAEYWQNLISDGQVSTIKRWDPEFYKQLEQGKVLALVDAAWNSALIASNEETLSGKWAVAPMPTWGSSATTANSGGSAVAVLKGCQNPQQAVDFATWLNSAEESMRTLASPSGGGLYPAAVAALDYGVVNQAEPFFGGQVIAEAFKASAEQVDVDWAWGPTYLDTNTALADGLARVSTADQTIQDLLKQVQASTLEDMAKKGISAKAAG
ncbi:MAG: sugar ABC transporter substrate-binding protein [Bifidobacteriaceae bacterium]|jgi:multiple sugar transport system substrate-binding protein|nr:sugar ABC transporter substrate-binding protein [Bifidobacteriaceae bacterium]